MTSRGLRITARRLAWVLGGGVLLATTASVVILAWPMDTAPYLRVSVSGELLDRSGQLLYTFLNEDEQWCFGRELDAVSPRLKEATMAAEDKRFRSHPGVDAAAVLRAAGQNVRNGRVMSGASTLTMQVVKQTTLREAPRAPTRTLWSKAVEAVQALRLEARIDKDGILQAYLNTAPYGLNLVGCEAASRRYFGKPARELTLSEAALLAGLPKAPTTLMPLRHKEAAAERRNYVLRRMLEEGYITQGECERAEQAPLGVRWHDFPADAPHVAMRLRSQTRREGRVMLTLDKIIQARSQRCAKSAIEQHHGNIGNAAVIVMDVPTANVLAHVGSADFFETPGGGQVDACRSLRSPGSALKPFTYALAMERNRLYACERLLDRTLDYGLYSPENIDGAFYGLISASDALKFSLNVPAVTVLERIGVEEVYTCLQGLGFTTLAKPPEHYGLGLTLGNCEVRLDQLAAAYCMLARKDGDSNHLLPPGEGSPARRSSNCTWNCHPHCKGGAINGYCPHLFPSRGTCLKLFEMLEQPLPDGFGRERVSANLGEPRVCWKTGTSTGQRDAWAVVFNAQYVVAVWMGNNDGSPSSRLIGARSALPLAADVFRALPKQTTPEWPVPGDELHPVGVCAVSGLPATPWCAHTKRELLPRTQFLHRRCDVHYPVHVNGSERVAERWPGRARGWDLADIASPVPAKSVESEKQERLEALRILAPSGDAEYILTGEAQGDRIRLQASVDQEGPLFWYLDDAYLGKSEPHRPLFLDLEPGSHRVACMSEDGMLDSLSFNVAHPEGPVDFVN